MDQAADASNCAAEVTVGAVAILANGTLSLSVNAIGTKKRLLDHFDIPPTSGLGTSTGPTAANGQLTLQIVLGESATPSALQSFLRGIMFSTRGKGLKTLTRTLHVTLTDHEGLSATISQAIEVRKR